MSLVSPSDPIQATHRTILRPAATLALLFMVGMATAQAAANRVHATPPTALDRYVAAPDTNFEWHVVNTLKQEGATVHILGMTSQAYLTTNEFDKPLWHHWITVVVPDDATNTTGLLVISGGSNNRPAPTKVDTTMALLARASKSVVAGLTGIPSEPLIAPDRTNKLSEDGLIAYTWDKFLRTGDEKWPARLPMTKASVRAMDAVTAFCATEAAGKRTVDKFFVTGASKRGWTTWTTAAVDPRVVAISPIVIDVLNVEASLKGHYESYGFFAPAVGNYTNENIPSWMGTPQNRALMKIEDPYEYRARYTIPKYLINAAGDQFFATDSARFYFNDLPGPKYLRAVPNVDHGVKGGDPWLSLLAFYDAILKGAPLPDFAWNHEKEGVVKVTPKTKPTGVRLWKATNAEGRDFRLEKIGPAWTSTDLTPSANGDYTAEVSKPEKGWTAYFVELTFPSSAMSPFIFTTDPRVVPDTRPFKFVPAATPGTFMK
ncbi:MAG TPA: PhoPQ-activated pathogenicity [Verrucomicrobiales bacterium]|nr:PhoPQ-activated pathogenicity [Verrucomicrobiales bacterium]